MKDDLSCSEDEFLTTFKINTLGVLLGIQAVAPEMEKVGGGSIVNIDSIGGLTSGDVAGCQTDGETMSNALTNAIDALSLMFFDEDEPTGLTKDLPEPKHHTQEEAEKEYKELEEVDEVPAGACFVMPVSFDPVAYYKEHYFKLVRKSVNIPAYLDENGKEFGFKLLPVIDRCYKAKTERRNGLNL